MAPRNPSCRDSTMAPLKRARPLRISSLNTLFFWLANMVNMV